MSNPFDQFDGAGGNPFDQFDQVAEVQPQTPDPTDGMSNAELVAAGAGKAVNDLGLGAQQGVVEGVSAVNQIAQDARDTFTIPGTDIPIGPGLIKYAPSLQIANYIADKLGITDPEYKASLQAQIDEAKQNDQALMETTPGKVGYVGGAVAAGAPTMLVPGANTYAGAAAVGALIGAAQPVSSDEGGILETKAENAATGAAFGAAGQAVGKMAGNAINRIAVRRAAAQAGRQAASAEKNATLAAAQEAGYVVPPAATEGNMTGKILSGLSGKAKTEQLARIRNQRATNDLARNALGLGDDVSITPEVTQAVRRSAFESGYRPLSNLGEVTTDETYNNTLNAIIRRNAGASRSFPDAATNDIAAAVEPYRVALFNSDDALQQIQVLRDAAGDAFRQGNSQLGKAYREVSGALEDQLERSIDSKEMLGAFREARRLMAKSHTVEEALVVGTGNVDATKLAAALQKGKPLTGDLETIGKFANAFRDSARTPSGADANPLTVLDFASGGFGAGLSASTPAGAILLGLPAARVSARYGVLSGVGQRMFTRPNYGSGVIQRFDDLLQSDTAQALPRLAAPSVYAAEQ